MNDTRDGIETIWHPRSPDAVDEGPRHSGYETALVEAVEGGTRVGHLRISYVSDELAAQVAGNGLAYKCNVAGWCIDLAGDPAEVWVRAHLYHGRPPRSRPDLHPRALRTADAPTGDELTADLDAIADHYDTERLDWIETHRTPVVAASRVEATHRRRGIATAMYLRAATELAATGTVLRASGVQSDAAEALWAKFAERGLTTTVEEADRRGEQRSRLQLAPCTVVAAAA